MADERKTVLVFYGAPISVEHFSDEEQCWHGGPPVADCTPCERRATRAAPIDDRPWTFRLG